MARGHLRASAPQGRALRKELPGGAIELLAESPEVPQSLDRAAAVPRRHFSVDESDALFPQQRLGAQRRDVGVAEEGGFTRKQPHPRAVEEMAGEGAHRLATRALTRA